MCPEYSVKDVTGIYQEGSIFLHVTKHLPSRIFKFSQSFYSILQHRQQQIIFGERPGNLCAIKTVDQRIWEKHQTYLKRLENFPLKKARYYQQLKETTGIKSVRGLAEITGEDWSYIARVLKTLELPQQIQQFLNSNQDPETVRHFHLKRLLELVRLGDETLQFNRFREMLREINR